MAMMVECKVGYYIMLARHTSTTIYNISLLCDTREKKNNIILILIRNGNENGLLKILKTRTGAE